MRTLIWFRSDLRIDDNPALSEALHHGRDGCLAVFFCTPEQWQRHDWGGPKVDFTLRCLQALSDELDRIGVPLVIDTVQTFAEAPARLVEIAQHYGCSRVLFNREYEVNEKRRDEETEALLSAADIAVDVFDDQTILPPGSVKTGQGTFYTIFSPFRRSWVQRLEESGVPTVHPRAKRAAPRLDIESSPVPELPDFGSFDTSRLFPAGEAAARERLERFIEERIETYDTSRDLAAEDATSALSPYLALGVLSVRRCLAAALAANEGRLQGGNKGVDTWIGELVWREFYRHVLTGFPRVSRNRAFKTETENVEWRDDPTGLEAWSRGKTGIPFVDAGMRQLLATGWMHNRLRMVTAMFLTKDLLIDWRLGEAFFMQHLVDADLANNNGGWQWSASTGTDAAPYFRIFNPWTQGKRYDPDGEFIRRWVPELADLPATHLHDPKGLSAIERSARDYPEPIVDHSAARIRAIEAFQETS